MHVPRDKTQLRFPPRKSVFLFENIVPPFFLSSPPSWGRQGDRNDRSKFHQRKQPKGAFKKRKIVLIEGRALSWKRRRLTHVGLHPPFIDKDAIYCCNPARSVQQREGQRMSIGEDWQRIRRSLSSIEPPKTAKQIEADGYHLISSASIRIYQAANDDDATVRVLGRRLRNEDTARNDIGWLYNHNIMESKDLSRDDFVGAVQTLFDWCVKEKLFCFITVTNPGPKTSVFHLHARVK